MLDDDNNEVSIKEVRRPRVNLYGDRESRVAVPSALDFLFCVELGELVRNR